MLSCWCQQILSGTHVHIHTHAVTEGVCVQAMWSHNYCHPSRDRWTKFCWNNKHSDFWFRRLTLSSMSWKDSVTGEWSSPHKGHWGHQSDDWRQAIQMMPSESVHGAINTVPHVTNYLPVLSLWTVSFLGRKTFLLGYFNGISAKQFPTSAKIQELLFAYSSLPATAASLWAHK